MSDLTKRNYGGQTSRLQGDMERALAGIRGDVDASDDYTPEDPDFWDPQPTTKTEALNRIVRWLNDRHGGDMPIGE